MVPVVHWTTAALSALCSLRPFEDCVGGHASFLYVPRTFHLGRLDPALSPPPFPRGLCSWKVPSQQLSSEWSQDTDLSRILYLQEQALFCLNVALTELFSLEIPCAVLKL